MEKNVFSLLSAHRSPIMGGAIIWIMLFHAPFEINNEILLFFKGIGYGGVDMFLFLSGFGLYFSMSKKTINLSQYYWKRFMRILPEFWFFLIVEFLINFDFSIRSFVDLLCCASTLGYWIPMIPYKLWYISSILFFYTLFPFYYYLYKKYGIRVPIAAISIGLIIVLLYALIMVFVFDNNNVGGLTILTFSRIPIFFIGSIIGKWTKEGRELKLTVTTNLIAISVFIIALFMLYYFRMNMTPYLSTCSLNFLPFIIITPILCAILAEVFDKIPQIITKLFSYIGQISLELFIVHVYLYSTVFEPFKDKYGSTLSFAIVFFMSFVFAIVLYNINKYFLQRIIVRS